MKQLLITIAAVVLVGCGPSVDIHKAAKEGNIEAVKQHIAAGTDVNAKDEFEWTPLHCAAYKGNSEIVELLIANGADVDAKDEYGRTPLHRAARYGFKEVAELLITNGANVKYVTVRTPLDVAIEYKRTETADLLRKHSGKTGEELSIHQAAKKGNIEAVKQHLAAGADVNAKTDDGVTPLDWAILLKKTATADLLRKHGGKTGEELKAEGK